jgi:Ca2+-binding RTX toxin-like protein
MSIRHRCRRLAFAALIAAALLSTFAGLDPFGPAGSLAAEGNCDGRPATILDDVSPVVYGTAGDDVIVALADGQQVFGQAGNDTICVGMDAVVDAGSGHDVVLGPLFSDSGVTAYGGSGNDGIIFVDVAFGGSGNDFVVAGYTASGQSGNDELYAVECDGGSGHDTDLGCQWTVGVP